MAFQAAVQDRSASPQLLASNNPFRRAASPQPPPYSTLSPQSPTGVDDRRVSTNPFLDSYRSPPQNAQTAPPPRPVVASPPQPDRRGAARTTELLAGLSLDDNSRRAPPPQTRRPPQPQSSTHRHTHSQEGERRARQNKDDPFNVFASPPRNPAEARPQRPRVRRNSESSVMDFQDDSQRRRERRPGDRSRPDKENRDRDPSKSSRSKKVRPARGLDLIDRLDITGIYGPGMIHHDGPFDACNPHRNKKGHRAAPMQAFPEGSQNNALGGGPPRRQMDYDMFHGRSHQGFTDYNDTMQVKPGTLPPRPQHNGKQKQSSWDAKEKIEPVHGEETAGLGTSTFFEGTVANRVTRRESDNDDALASSSNGGGLQRKRSIAQKIRGMSRARPGWGDNGVVRSPDRMPGSPGYYDGPASAGGRARMTDTSNPYFADVAATDLEVKKAAAPQVTIAPAGAGSSSTRPRTATNGSGGSPPLRPAQGDNVPNGSGSGVGSTSGGGLSAGPTGLLGRVKSLRGKKTRPERNGTA